jgi:hypothetical protein
MCASYRGCRCVDPQRCSSGGCGLHKGLGAGQPLPPPLHPAAAHQQRHDTVPHKQRDDNADGRTDDRRSDGATKPVLWRSVGSGCGLRSVVTRLCGEQSTGVLAVACTTVVDEGFDGSSPHVGTVGSRHRLIDLVKP